MRRSRADSDESFDSEPIEFIELAGLPDDDAREVGGGVTPRSALIAVVAVALMVAIVAGVAGVARLVGRGDPADESSRTSNGQPVEPDPATLATTVALAATVADAPVTAPAPAPAAPGENAPGAPDATRSPESTSPESRSPADPTSSSDPTSSADPTASGAPAPAPPGPDSPAPPTTLAELPLGEPTGLILYLTPVCCAPDSILAIEVDTGIAHTVPLETGLGWYVRAVPMGERVYVDGASVISLNPIAPRMVAKSGETGITDAPFGRVAPGPDGGVWVRTFDGPEPALVLVGPTGQPLGAISALPLGADLFGSMADGRAVVRGKDGRAFVVEPDGSRSELPGIPIFPVEAGRYVHHRCNEFQQCELTAETGSASVSLAAIVEPSQPVEVRFQRDGPLAAIAQNGAVHVVDLSSPEGLSPELITRRSRPGRVEPGMRFFPGRRALAVQSDGAVLIHDLDRDVSTMLWTGGETSLLGVGTQVLWN